MAKISRNIVILICVMFCVLFLAGHLVGPTAEAQAKKSEQIQDPYKNTTILVEAFVVEVDLSALYDLGVSPIGQKPNSVSIENILKCLQDKESAQVSTGAKVVLLQKQSGSADSKETIYRGQQAPIRMSDRSNRTTPKAVRSYNISSSFDALVNILPDSRIFVSFNFEQFAVEKVSSKSELLPTTIERGWSGTACLEAGKPSIAGATQDEQKAVFFILCGDIKSE